MLLGAASAVSVTKTNCRHVVHAERHTMQSLRIALGAFYDIEISFVFVEQITRRKVPIPIPSATLLLAE